MDNAARPGFVRVFEAEKPAELTPLQRQLGELLRSRRGADVILSCGGGGGSASGTGGGGPSSAAPAEEQTEAHALILALRSGTLQKQLEWGQAAQQQPAAGGGGGVAPAGALGAAPPALLRRLEIDPAVEPPILDKLLQFMCAPRCLAADLLVLFF